MEQVELAERVGVIRSVERGGNLLSSSDNIMAGKAVQGAGENHLNREWYQGGTKWMESRKGWLGERKIRLEYITKRMGTGKIRLDALEKNTFYHNS